MMKPDDDDDFDPRGKGKLPIIERDRGEKKGEEMLRFDEPQASHRGEAPPKEELKVDDTEDEVAGKNMRNLLKELGRPYIKNMKSMHGSSSTQCHGNLRYQKTRFGSFKQVYCIFRDGKIFVYKKNTDDKPKWVIQPSYYYYDLFTTREKEHLVATKNLRDISNHRFTIFATFGRMLTFTAKNDSELEPWEQAFRDYFSDIPVDERARLDGYAKEVVSGIDKQFHEDLQKAEMLMNALQTGGLMSSYAPPKKQGYLHLRSGTGAGAFGYQGDDGSKAPAVWKKLYFTLNYKILAYQNKDKHDRNTEEFNKKGLISLKFATIETLVKDDQGLPDKKSYELIITTPFVAYILRAKHEPALREWYSVLSEEIYGKKKNKYKSQALGSTGSLASEDEALGLNPNPQGEEAEYQKELIQYTKPRLDWVSTEKKRSFKIKDTITMIGRSSSNQIRVPDKSVSRQHARIDLANNQCIFTDLGSSQGTKINSKVTAKKVLVPGDQIQCGDSIFMFEAIVLPQGGPGSLPGSPGPEKKKEKKIFGFF